MASVESIRDKFTNLLQSLGQVIIETYKSTETKAAVFNKTQLAEGKKSDGTQIGTYSNMWANIRQSRGRQTEFVDLNFSGKHYDNLGFKKITEEYAELGSNISYESDITDRYGKDVYGLTQENTETYAKNSWLKEFAYQIKNRLWAQ